ncbi:unnamed protein product, partial [Amoebophrya sp. A25]|eukprot:GSA25T00015486001.1
MDESGREGFHAPDAPSSVFRVDRARGGTSISTAANSERTSAATPSSAPQKSSQVEKDNGESTSLPDYKHKKSIHIKKPTNHDKDHHDSSKGDGSHGGHFVLAPVAQKVDNLVILASKRQGGADSIPILPAPMINQLIRDGQMDE